MVGVEMRDPVLLVAVVAFVVFLIWKLLHRGPKWGDEIYDAPIGSDDQLIKLLEEAKISKNHKEITKKLEQLIESIEDNKQKAYYYTAIAEMYKGPLKNRGKAISYYIKAFESCPECERVIKELYSMLKGRQGKKRLENLFWFLLSSKKSIYTRSEYIAVLRELANFYSINKKGRRGEAILNIIELINVETTPQDKSSKSES